MLKFESVFWAAKNREELAKKLGTLGFSVTPSRRDPQIKNIYFGPESIELFSPSDTLTTMTQKNNLVDFLQKGDGIFGVGLESDHLIEDYKRIQALSPVTDKPRGAKNAGDDVPLWYGFNLPEILTPEMNAWTVMDSPSVLNRQAREVLPFTHQNTCFGIEGIHVVTDDPEGKAAIWAKLLEKQSAGLHWNELDKTFGKRLQSGDRFFDLLKTQGKLAASPHPIFMLTLRVADLEYAKQLCEKAGAKILRCASRDGFIIPAEITGGPALRMVRSFWKRYLPQINSNFPMGRRRDHFRPLGGANSSTLVDGFQDNWDY